MTRLQRHRLAVNLTFFVNGFLYANWVARIPRIQEMYGMDNGALGIVLLAAAIGALFAMPFTGWLIVRNGSERVTIVGALAFLATVAAIPWMPSVIVLGSLYFLMGLGTGTMDVAMNAQAVMVERDYGRPIMSFFHAIFSAGMMLGAGCGAIFTYLSDSISFSTHLLIVTGFCLLISGWSLRHLMDDQPDHDEKSTSVFRLPDSALWGIGLIAFCCMLGEGAMADWSTNYMRFGAGAEKGFAPIGLAAFSLAMMLGRFGGDSLRTRLGDRRLVVGSSLLACCGLGLALVFPYPLVVVAGLLLVGLGLATIVPIAYSTAGNMPGLASGVGIGMVTTIGYSGFLFGPPIIGFVADAYSLRLALGGVFVLFLLMTFLSFRFRPNHSN